MPFIGLTALNRFRANRAAKLEKQNSQKLILPMKNSRQVCGYKNRLYREYWGFVHYGWDFNSSESQPNVYSMGRGTVIRAGYDSLFGWCCVIVYPDVWIRGEKRKGGITARYYHMREMPVVHPGQDVQAGDIIGIMGNTGKYTSGPHLHITLDTDTAHPCYEPGIARDGEIIKKGVDTTIDPADVLYIDRRWQTIKNGAYAGWNSPGDYMLPDINEED